MAVQIQLRRGTSSDWTNVNPTLGNGEIGVEYDSGKFKLGNGTSNWNSLQYFTTIVSGSTYQITSSWSNYSISASYGISSSFSSTASANFSNLTSINNLLTNITASNISASNNLSASNIYVENTINADTGSFVYFNINNTGSAPTNYTSSGMPGEIRCDNNFIYIYTNNRWVRSPISKWE